ncbi:uncharacterized protein TEOVI_000911000 [Trypanosoma equiperdum]|uniref:Inward rectifier potassium channel C-terminal domain-containing protein n=1 Tax=Trypanosoma equiperdum TaxID=5694 RepID=A0A1G4I933_TRYEQ|nr:hypothetical protein, conserved [Trypanosoma equiperdum]
MSSRMSQKLRGHSLAPKRQKPLVNPELLLASPTDSTRGGSKQFVRAFNDDGCLSTREVGVRWFNFALLSIFYTLRSQPWSLLITYTILLYVGILFVFSAAYVVWARGCGAQDGSTWVSALYFTVVSFAANGGYVGEQQDTMLDPHHVCFTGRTLIVTLLSFGNIIFVGLVAALVVGKAAYGEELGHRIVFSDFCSLAMAPGTKDRDCWDLTFRMANSSSSKALAHGQLRLFIVTSEPTDNSRHQRKRRKSSVDRTETRRHATSSHHHIDDKSKRSGQLSKHLEHHISDGTVQTETHPHRREGELDDVTRMDRESREWADAESHIVEVLAEEHLKRKRGREHTSKRQVLSSPATSSCSSDADGGASFGGATGSGCSYVPINSPESALKQVSIQVEELRWTCSGEKHLDGRDGRLLLWFPVDITHTINRYSPLYRYVKHNMTNSLCTLNSLQVASPAIPQEAISEEERRPAATAAFPCSFQLVVIFDATEMESGRHISARHTYAADDIIKHYRFSNKVVRMSPEKREVLVDYHYFNEMLSDVVSPLHRTERVRTR